MSRAIAESVVQHLKALVATPSQAGIDPLDAVLGAQSAWLKAHDVPHALTGAPRAPLAIVINPPDTDDEEVWVLNACMDTAAVGDLAQWQHAPFAGEVHGGWLYGRGSADSKAAVAIFSALARRVPLTSRSKVGGRRRRVTIVLDNDEHSGRFGGIKSYTTRYGFPQHCAIGYPGFDEVVAGSRGFFRTVLTLRGAMGHSGASEVPRELATTKLHRLLRALDALSRRKPADAAVFPYGPRATCTQIVTGPRTFSVTAPKIECAIDIRLTPEFNATAAERFVRSTARRIGMTTGDQHPTTWTSTEGWPPYRTADDALLPRLMQAAAKDVLGRELPLAVSGPSNIGNYLAGQGTQVLCGFGVDYRGLHGPDECVRLDTIADVYAVYAAAVRRFVAGR
jgi:succinyl-diaminopimelate desuccinylase